MSIRISKVYTKAGDAGDTHLVGGQKVGKDNLRIEAYGTVDELNAVFGLTREALRTRSSGPRAEDDVAPSDTTWRSKLDAIFERVQQELFNLGSDLATLDADRHPQQPVIHERHVERLEREIDELNAELPELRSFVLPGGGPVSSHLHLARTVCRRAERIVVALSRAETIRPECVRYLNRLSDACFVFGRWAAVKSGEDEVLWKPEKV